MILRFLFFLLVFYLIYNLVRNLFIRSATNATGGNSQSSSRKDGDVSISFNPDKSKPHGSKLGEYVDYEELED